MRALLLVAALFCACKSTYPDDDQAANTTAAKAEARIVELCAVDAEDAGLCTPAHVRAFADLAYCANARELAVHGAPVPEAGGLQCQPQ